MTGEELTILSLFFGKSFFPEEGHKKREDKNSFH
jgi:hypothetical protein